MDSADTAGLLPLASVRLLVAPLHLLSASMWQTLKKRDVRSFWRVSEFVCLVMEAVPELLLVRTWTRLVLGLRARFVLDLCRRGEEAQIIQPYVEMLKPHQPRQHKELWDEEEAGEDFAEVIQVLLTDNHERQAFFQEFWSEEFGARFDSDLQTLFWEFLCRLNQLLPQPEVEQIVLWLGQSSLLGEFEPTHMKNLLHHHKQLGHLEQHVPPCGMGDHISSSLSAASQNRRSKLQLKSLLERELPPPLGSNVDLQAPSTEEEAAVEIFAVTECAEIELTATAMTDVQVILIDSSLSQETLPCDTEETEGTLPEDVPRENSTTEKNAAAILREEPQETTTNDIEFVEDTRTAEDAEKSEAKDNNTENKNELKRTAGPHSCPDCDKTFRFASFLSAHRVVHTGERPHKCSECGRCFSFRQSLERHRNMHKTGKSFQCPECHKGFSSSAARSEHKLTHTQDGEYRHLKTHSDSNSREEIVEITEELTQERTEKISEETTEEIAEGNIPETASEAVEEESKKLSSEFKISAIDVQLMNQVISLVQVRTSRRKSKATKKMRSLQKKVEGQKEAEKAKDGGTKMRTSYDHSYGTTTNHSSLKVHKGIIRKAASFSCLHCDFCHSEKAQLQQHIRDSHWEHHETEGAQTPETEAGKENGHKTGGSFKCAVCGEPFQSLKDRQDHVLRTHMRNGAYFCSRCGKTFTWRGAFVRHVRMYCSVGEANSFACPRCELALDCASALYSHVQTHQEERVHVCDCGKSFAYKAALTAHQRTHQKDRPHACPLCGRGFLYKGGLLGHMKTHSQEMSFKCFHCGKGFKRERNMKRHERCHTREGVHKCSRCEKSFVYKATLTRHELTHTGERPFLCSSCGKGFFSHAELLKHERFHSGKKPFECPHCEKRFTQSCYLTVHLRYHTGAKPYACRECDKSFLSANRLKRHQRTHTGEKPYVCDECGKGFGQSYHLKIHQRTHVIDLT